MANARCGGFIKVVLSRAFGKWPAVKIPARPERGLNISFWTGPL